LFILSLILRHYLRAIDIDWYWPLSLLFALIFTAFRLFIYAFSYLLLSLFTVIYFLILPPLNALCHVTIIFDISLLWYWYFHLLLAILRTLLSFRFQPIMITLIWLFDYSCRFWLITLFARHFHWSLRFQLSLLIITLHILHTFHVNIMTCYFFAIISNFADNIYYYLFSSLPPWIVYMKIYFADDDYCLLRHFLSFFIFIHFDLHFRFSFHYADDFISLMMPLLMLYIYWSFIHLLHLLLLPLILLFICHLACFFFFFFSHCLPLSLLLMQLLPFFHIILFH